MDRNILAEVFKQIIEGRDFADCKRLVNVKSDIACFIPAGCPYSMATNVWHCDFWNRLWLARLNGQKRPSANIYKDDWHVPPPEEWLSVKESFLANLNRAHQMTTDESFEHAMEDDDKAMEKLTQIAIHTAYHVGQIALVKRMAKAEMKTR